MVKHRRRKVSNIGGGGARLRILGGEVKLLAGSKPTKRFPPPQIFGAIIILKSDNIAKSRIKLN